MSRSQPYTLALCASVAALAALLAGGAGCELAIGDGLPAFACDQGPDTCPEGQTCDPERHQCVAFCTPTGCPASMQCDPASRLCKMATDGSIGPTDASVDGGVEAHDAPVESDVTVVPDDTGTGDEKAVEDASTETNGGDSSACTGLMCKCVGNSACDSHICADQLTVGTGLYMAAGAAAFCTKPCCTSADCPADQVCYATASSSSSGSYCVLPLWLQRSTQLGTATGGQACMMNASCRSGLCAGNVCADTCCSTTQSSTECVGGMSCAFGDFPGIASFDQGYAAYCSPGGTSPNGSMCNFPNDCAGGRCAGFGSTMTCQDACRSTADCAGQGFTCSYGRDRSRSNTVFPACFSSAGGSTAQGGSCQRDADCQSGFCDPTAMVCTDVCAGDSDCTPTGWRCRPEQITLQSGGVASVLCCGT